MYVYEKSESLHLLKMPGHSEGITAQGYQYILNTMNPHGPVVYVWTTYKFVSIAPVSYDHVMEVWGGVVTKREDLP